MYTTATSDTPDRTAEFSVARLGGETVRTIELHRAADAPPRTERRSGVERRQRSERLNRIVNVTIAAVALILLAPVLLIVAIGVRLTSPGPILYRQTRVGIERRRRSASGQSYDRRACDLGGTVFSIWKFRSMYIDAEKRTGAVWATANDPRITPFGRMLRKTRLDELPQLFNVLLGDMNIVGPRPERPSIFARLSKQVPDYSLRQHAKPGITGWAQINQRYDTCLEDVQSKVRYDLEYISRQSLGYDLSIMLKTVPVMLFKRGAQ